MGNGKTKIALVMLATTWCSGFYPAVSHADGRKTSKQARMQEQALDQEQDEADESASKKRRGAAPGEPDSDSCGLGWQVTNKKTFLATTTRGTTNYVVPPTFGMTSGTMGCVQHSFAGKDQDAAAYAMANYDALSVEMAEGRGEFLEALARTMGCSGGAIDEFGRMTQQRYRSIFNAGKATPVQMFKNVKHEVRQHPALARGCA